MKNILLIHSFLALNLTAAAQITGPTMQQQDHNVSSYAFAPNAGIGIKGGVNFSNIRGSDTGNLGNTSGHTNFHAGVFAQFPIGDHFSVQPEVLYSRKGYELNDAIFRFDYLELPVLAAYNITNHISVHAGPQVGIMLSAKEEGKEVDLEPYNTFDYGVAAGIEGHFSRYRIGARYNLHFADLRSQDLNGNNINEDIKHRVAHIYVGVSF
ncbi:porin family protein [Pontibacter arcticus]|uniref:PorT family protein n=1 Tax=Pontibacter arcticus TaxID=2080288 RepID=A0A364RIB6_9BACT|nr:porin family protein [Pontibacter arcticus]RAU84037.1 PorT family protein [Pontibacter arcticus]